ncbi:gliding motility-associated C-terminal domain-containing protein [Panacibacter ginsenosidivorans]|uniref:gliding motility-associated C-terminal domain-containing protein n=1 Tax=Panacibacter ginsenosidivorans TaxID=1813871 RepID=UPI001315A82B|nr:gliding motility-associated C-terminal domain-containing protein [Panacibacter ginsenosidivorans]
MQTGLPPSNQIFNTASNGLGGRLAANTEDHNWHVTTDSINGVYAPAIVMGNLPPDYYISIWHDCTWISINQSGAHSHDHLYFYKMNFDLPCFTPCGKSYNEEGTFCLSLDLLADNSIYEIYVNGIAQSGNLGGIIPVNDPYHAVSEDIKGKVSVSLCHNWKAGNNSIVVAVASSAPETGILIQASSVLPDNVSNYITDSICEGHSFRLGNENITQKGYTFRTIKTSGGCDSTIVLNLSLKPKAISSVDQSICEGQSYLGHSVAGTYTDTFAAANGCDSIRTLHLSVVSKPDPQIEMTATYCEGDSLILLPGNFLSYLWQDGSTENYYTVKTPGLYSVTVANACGTTTKSTTVSSKACQIVFPSAFTPNKDGKNDYFKVLTHYTFDEYDLVVYNRWGQKVFETKDASKGWDGTFNGKLQSSGSDFIWYCKFKRSGVATEMKGYVVLIL